jgi:hypothetical protein
MTAIFTTIGSAADYGGFGRYVLLFFTIVCWAAQFASMSLTSKLLFMTLCTMLELRRLQSLHAGVLLWLCT